MELSPTDFVALVNQTLEFAYPSVVIEGELANFRVSKNRWIYFDLKDEFSSVKFFGTVYNLPGPLEEGMTLKVTGSPRLHPQYGFSVTIQSIALSGEGTIKKAFELLLKKLTLEGLFEQERKRILPYPPQRIGLITSGESAAYADFVKILGVRWGGVEISHADVQVQGEVAAGQIVRAVEYFNSLGMPPEVLVVIRGGGSADDLQTFNTEIVTRAIAASRIPTLVAIGHEVDTSLAELAADLRASTPSNAAELLVPDKADILSQLASFKVEARRLLSTVVKNYKKEIKTLKEDLFLFAMQRFEKQKEWLGQSRKILELVSPMQVLKRGYSVARKNGKVVRSVVGLKHGDRLDVMLSDGTLNTKVQ